MKKLFLLLILSLFFPTQSFAKLCDDGSSPTRVISDDGSYYKSVCKNQKNTYKNNNSSESTVSTYPLAIQPDSLDVFCDKVNADCSDSETQKWYRAYYTLPWNKAMAIAYPKGRILGGISGAYFWYGESTPNQAKAKAMSRCNTIKAVYSDKCYVLLVNHLIVNKDYIKLLNKKTSSQSSNSSNSYSSQSNSSKKIPANAFKSGNTWYCKAGYYKHFVSTREICKLVPKNATKNSDDRTWSCNTGYVKSDNSCIKKSENETKKTKVSSEPTQNESIDYLEEIKQAKALLDSGIITQDEFEEIKKKIIDNI